MVDSEPPDLVFGGTPLTRSLMLLMMVLVSSGDDVTTWVLSPAIFVFISSVSSAQKSTACLALSASVVMLLCVAERLMSST